ncbi:MAG: bifunctional glutamate N-acetyltransferase/amino-acid acetyltransferase ArgJ [Pseudomonadota bacterium]
MSTVSPLAPSAPPELPEIAGVKLAMAQAGIKYAGREDLMVMVFDEPTAVAGVLTQSKCPSAPVDICRQHLSGGKARALVVNSGNANAFTGKKGRDAADETVAMTAKAISCAPEEVFVSSTGVIGEPLEAKKFENVLADTLANAASNAWLDAANAIKTTDTFPKLCTRTVTLGGRTITINGIAKGAGMIAPDMATMLAYIVTDARVSASALQSMLSGAVGKSFNAISVDTDTSTSDTLLAFATGAAGNEEINTENHTEYAALNQAIASCMHDLALQIVGDGEGISRRIRVDVTGAVSDQSAKTIGMSIANSPLVKTAISGADANWGRVVMAVGKAGEPADRDRLSIWFCGARVAVEGERDTEFDEESIAQAMTANDISIAVDIGLGQGQFTVWGCDLTKDYVAINGDYRS